MEAVVLVSALVASPVSGKTDGICPQSRGAIVPSAFLVGQFMRTFNEFLPSQAPGSSTLNVEVNTMGNASTFGVIFNKQGVSTTPETDIARGYASMQADLNELSNYGTPVGH